MRGMAVFLSTPSARRATRALTPKGGDGTISIHALREEGDRFYEALSIQMAQFLSTPSARRATLDGRGDLGIGLISIHALREEGDFWDAPM